MKFFDVEHPFFLPLWRRVGVVALCAVWSAVEWAAREPFWAVLATGFAVWTLYAMILTFDPERAARGGDK